MNLVSSYLLFFIVFLMVSILLCMRDSNQILCGYQNDFWYIQYSSRYTEPFMFLLHRYL